LRDWRFHLLAADVKETALVVRPHDKVDVLDSPRLLRQRVSVPRGFLARRNVEAAENIGVVLEDEVVRGLCWRLGC
jgi:hypothetical protein